MKGLVRRGAVFPESAIAFIGSEDLFGSSEMVARPGPTKSQMAAFAADLADQKPGADFVVHATHGVGKFLGIREIVQGDQKGDFMLLEYSSHAKLYVPLTRMDLVEIPGRRRFAAAARSAGRRVLDCSEIAGQSENAGHGG